MSRPTEFSEASYRQRVTIVGTESESGALDVRGISPRGVSVAVPSAWTAADIGLAVTEDDPFDDDITPSWFPLRDAAGGRVRVQGIITDEANQYMFPTEAWGVSCWPYLRLESLDTGDGSAEAQAADRVLIVGLLI